MFILPRGNRFVTCRPEKQSDSIRAYSNTNAGALSILNNTDAESHSSNLIHRISFTELKFKCRTRVAEGTSAGRSTLRHNRTHAPTGPERARTYMRIYRERRKMEEKGANARRKSEKRKPPRARREKILNYRKWPRRPCCNSMNCATYSTACR